MNRLLLLVALCSIIAAASAATPTLSPLGVGIVAGVTEGSVQNIDINVIDATLACCQYSVERSLASAAVPSWSVVTDDRFKFDSSFASTTLRVTAVSTDVNFIYRVKAVDNADVFYSPDTFSFDVNQPGVIGRNIILPSAGKGSNFKVYWTPPGVEYEGYRRDIFTAVVSSGGSSIPVYLTLENPAVSSNRVQVQRRLGHNSYWYRITEFVQVDLSGYTLASTANFDVFRQRLQDVLVPALRTVLGNPTGNYKIETIRRQISNTATTTSLLFYARSFATGQLISKANLQSAFTTAGFTAGNAFTLLTSPTTIGSGTVTGVSTVDYSIIRSVTSGTSGAGGVVTISLASNGAAVTTSSGTTVTTPRQLTWTPNPYYTSGLPSTSDQWTLEADGSNSDATFAAPFRGRPLYRLKTNNNLYLKINNDYNSATGVATVVGTNTAADAALFAVGSNSDSLYYLTDGTESGNAGSENAWAASPCAESSVENCKIVDDSPQYRRLELDLGGDFAVSSFVSIWDFYPVAARQNLVGGATATSLAWGGNNLRGFPNTANSALGFNFELWLKASTDANYEDYTGAQLQSDYNGCIGQRTPTGTTCKIEFNVASYARLTYGKYGNYVFRYIRVVLDGLPLQGEPGVIPFYRTLTARDFQVAGGCACNGHSFNCDLTSGSCSPVGTAGCQHFTTGTNCQSCSKGTFVNYGNKPITDPLDTVYTDSTATVTYVSPLNGESFTVTLKDGPLLLDKTYAELAETADPQASFDAYFHGGGPCVNCQCYNHDNLYVNGNGRGCDEITGVCDCSASSKTAGNNCEQCADGACRLTSDLYQDCISCNCNGHSTLFTGTGADRCDASTCGCTCDPADNVEGTYCEDCKIGHYSATGNGENGVDCVPCACNGHKASGFGYEVCDVTGGNCDVANSCTGNTRGQNCELCDEGFYRPFRAGGVIDLSDDCVPCTCNGLADPTTYFAGHTAICNPNGGQCNCRANENVQGMFCEDCLSGYFSSQSTSVSYPTQSYTANVGCDACECNSHKGIGNVCNPRGGNCNKDFNGNDDFCQDNTEGFNCENCQTTFFRPCSGGLCNIDLTDGCQRCDCNGHAVTRVGGFDTCDQDGGFCTCTSSSNSEGDNCESCKPNTWNTFGNSEDGRDCSPCFCYGHSSTCNSFGVCSGCQGNTKGDNCEDCSTDYTRSTPVNPLDSGNPAVIETARYDTCTACFCNGHSTTCDSFTGVCSGCQGNTQNDAWPNAKCNRCDSNYFRQLQGSYDSSLDVCSACSLPSGSCLSQTLANDCSTCSLQCFGGVSACDETTGECTECYKTNSFGIRCEKCLPGYFGDPVNGIPCTPCDDACYHSTDKVWASESVSIIGSTLLCEANVAGTSRACIFDQTRLAAVLGGATINSGVICNCPTASPGLHQTLDSIPPYNGRQCDSCNSAGFFGTPTVCKVPGPSGTALGDCSEFYQCLECGCNGNIDEDNALSNCAYSAATPSQATCSNCKGDTTGDACESCAAGKYGYATRTDVTGVYPGYPVDNVGNNLKCFDCDCNGRSTVRVGGSSTVSTDFDTCTATGAGNVGDYTCSCSYPYTGPTCRQCARGYEPVADSTDGTNSAPGYVFCAPCPTCVLALYNQGIIPLENDASSLASDYTALNASVVQLENDVALIKTKVTRRSLDGPVDAAATGAPSAEFEFEVKALIDEAKAALETATNANERKLGEAEAKLQSLSSSVSDALSSIRTKLAQVDVTGKLNPATAQAAAIAAQLAQSQEQIAALQTSVRDFESRSSESILAHLTRLVAAESASEAAVAEIQEFKAKASARLEEMAPLAKSLASQVASVSESFTSLSASIHAAVEEKNRLIDEKLAAVTALDTLVSESLTSVKAFSKDSSDLHARIESMATTLQSLVDGAKAASANLQQRVGAASAEIETATLRIEAVKTEVNSLVESAKDKLGNSVETLSSEFAARLEALRTSFAAAVEAEKASHKSSAAEISASVSQAAQEARATLAAHSDQLTNFERQLKGIQIAMDDNVAELATKLSSTVSQLSTVVREASAGQFVLPEQLGYFISHANSEMDTLKSTVADKISKMDSYLKSSIAAVDTKLRQARTKAESDMDLVRVQAQSTIDAAFRDTRASIAALRSEQTSAISSTEARISGLVARAEQTVADGFTAARQETTTSVSAIKSWTEDRIAHIQAEVAAKAAAIEESARNVQARAKAMADSSVATASDKIAAKREETLAPLRAELAAALKSVAEVSASLSSLDTAAKRISNKIQSVEADNALARRQLKNLQENIHSFLSIPASVDLTADHSSAAESPISGKSSFINKNIHPGCRSGSTQPCPADSPADAVLASTASSGSAPSGSSNNGSSDLLLKVALPATGFVALVATILATVFYRKYRSVAANRPTRFDY